MKKIQTAERGKEGGLPRRVNRESFCNSCLSSHGKKNFTKTTGTRIHNTEVVYVNAMYARFIILNALVQYEARHVCK